MRHKANQRSSGHNSPNIITIITINQTIITGSDGYDIPDSEALRRQVEAQVSRLTMQTGNVAIRKSKKSFFFGVGFCHGDGAGQKPQPFALAAFPA